MRDQVRAMNERDVRAVYAGMADKELAESVCSGSFQLVYLSPESLLTDGHWCDMLQILFIRKDWLDLLLMRHIV